MINLGTIKLDIGAGGKSSDDSFISVDRYVQSADIIADMWDLPYEDGVVDVIFASNCLEHVSKFQVFPTLKEWERVLKVGGKLQIIVPDLIWACKWFIKQPTTGWSMDIIFGHQKHEGEFHKTGFTPEIMQLYLEDIPGLQLQRVAYLGMSLEDVDKEYQNGDKIEQRAINFEILRVNSDR
jgi:predicted SAM-dependent methyltransferase